jgi:signal transduction histidine kinase
VNVSNLDAGVASRSLTTARPSGSAADEFRHDLGQPLASIRLLVDSALSTAESTEDVSADVLANLRRIRRHTDWMADMLRQAGEQQPREAVFDLADAVEGPCLATPDDVPYDVRFVSRDKATVLVDPIGLRRSAWNLLDNARRAVAGGGQVEVKVSRHGRHAVLEVADSGPGFGGLAMQHGHGLAGVRTFAAHSGGSISIGTSSLGGALVTLRLPLVSTDAGPRG